MLLKYTLLLAMLFTALQQKNQQTSQDSVSSVGHRNDWKGLACMACAVLPASYLHAYSTLYMAP